MCDAAVPRSLRPAAEERAINNVVATAMAEAFNYRSSDLLRSAADGVLKVQRTKIELSKYSQEIGVLLLQSREEMV